MYTQHRQVGIVAAENSARAQRIIGAVMEHLRQHPTWRNPFERVTVHAAVDRCVTSMIHAGEASDEALMAHALQVVDRRVDQRR